MRHHVTVKIAIPIERTQGPAPGRSSKPEPATLVQRRQPTRGGASIAGALRGGASTTRPAFSLQKVRIQPAPRSAESSPARRDGKQPAQAESGELAEPGEHAEQSVSAAFMLPPLSMSTMLEGPVRTAPRESEPKTPAAIAKSTVPDDVESSDDEIIRTDASPAASRPALGAPIEVVRKNRPGALKLVKAAEYKKQYAAAAKNDEVRQEAGIPNAFLRVRSGFSISVGQAAQKAGSADILFATEPLGDDGQIWVTEAKITWTVYTEGYVNTDASDPRLEGAYKEHEEGHRIINQDIADRLAPQLQNALVSELPSKENPLTVQGKGWQKRAPSLIAQKALKTVNRYNNQWSELGTRGDTTWDNQEKVRLSRLIGAEPQKSARKSEYTPGELP